MNAGLGKDRTPPTPAPVTPSRPYRRQSTAIGQALNRVANATVALFVLCILLAAFTPRGELFFAGALLAGPAILLEVIVSFSLVTLWMAWPHRRRTFGSRLGFVAVALSALSWVPVDAVWFLNAPSRLPLWTASGVLGLALVIRIVAAMFNWHHDRRPPAIPASPGIGAELGLAQRRARDVQ
jgi:MFS family permease